MWKPPVLYDDLFFYLCVYALKFSIFFHIIKKKYLINVLLNLQHSIYLPIVWMLPVEILIARIYHSLCILNIFRFRYFIISEFIVMHQLSDIYEQKNKILTRFQQQFQTHRMTKEVNLSFSAKRAHIVHLTCGWMSYKFR